MRKIVSCQQIKYAELIGDHLTLIPSQHDPASTLLICVLFILFPLICSLQNAKISFQRIAEAMRSKLTSRSAWGRGMKRRLMLRCLCES